TRGTVDGVRLVPFGLRGVLVGPGEFVRLTLQLPSRLSLPDVGLSGPITLGGGSPQPSDLRFVGTDCLVNLRLEFSLRILLASQRPNHQTGVDPELLGLLQQAVVGSLLRRLSVNVLVYLVVLLLKSVSHFLRRLLDRCVTLRRLRRLGSEEPQQSDACGDSQAPRAAQYTDQTAEDRAEPRPSCLGHVADRQAKVAHRTLQAPRRPHHRAERRRYAGHDAGSALHAGDELLSGHRALLESSPQDPHALASSGHLPASCRSGRTSTHDALSKTNRGLGSRGNTRSNQAEAVDGSSDS